MRLEPDVEFNTKSGGCEDMNTAQVIPFQKPPQPKQEAGKSMYSDKFVQGYVMSSRLYRKEVWPFLSDAARNVYEQLENWINGQLKETDHISHRQIQGGELKGSNKLSSATVSSGLKELIWFEVVTVIEKNNRIGNKYQINEVSLVEYFEQFSALEIKALRFSNESASISEALQLVKRQPISNESASASGSGASIDIPLDSLDIKKRTSLVDNSETEIFSDSVEYHEDNKNLYSLRELAAVYTIQTDLADQAKRINPKLDDAKILSELKNFAQWSTSREKTTAQGWMNYWIYRIQKLSTTKAKSSKPKSKGLSDAQLNYFASELCNHHDFRSKHSNIGESQKAFESRINTNIRKPEYADTYGPYLHELGFVVDLGASL